MIIGYNRFTIANKTPASPEHAMVLVGAALNGPSHTPFSLNLDTNPYEVLGQSPLADAYIAAKRTGIEDIILYRLNGRTATATLKDKEDKEIIQFESICASSVYNNILVVAYPTHLYVVGTDNLPRSYFFDRYKTARELAYAINQDAHYGLVEFEASTIDEYYELENLTDIPSDIVFTGGDEEEELINHRHPLSERRTDKNTVTPVLKERLKVSLFGEDPEDIYERQPSSELGALQYGVIALCDMYHDDDPELTEILGSFCLHKTKEIGFGCIGVIGTAPIYPEVIDLGETEEFMELADLEETVRVRVLELVSISEELEDKEAYKYVQVVVGHTGYVESEEESISTCYGYAATQANLLYYTMMSNKRIRGVGKLNYEIKKEDIALLTANGYTCIVPSIRRGFVPYYATSYSKDKNSIMAKPHNLRISQYVSRILVEELDALVGSNYVELSIKEAIEVANDMLEELVVGRIIRDYEISYTLSKRNTMLSLDVSLTPFSEIKSISSIAVISFPRGVIE